MAEFWNPTPLRGCWIRRGRANVIDQRCAPDPGAALASLFVLRLRESAVEPSTGKYRSQPAPVSKDPASGSNLAQAVACSSGVVDEVDVLRERCLGPPRGAE
jgi:hypothetical protein